MRFRRKLLAVFALTVFLSVATVALIVSAMTRRSFERANADSTTALIAQFRREFNRRGEDVAHRVETIASSETTTRMALRLSHGTPDYGAYLDEARSLAENQQLDFLEFVDSQNTIISSAQSPATFGYKETFAFSPNVPKDAFLKQEGPAGDPLLALSAVRQVNLGDHPLYVIGGRRLDKDFLASLELPTGMRAMLYQNIGDIPFAAQFLTDAAGAVPNADRLSRLIEQVERQHQEATSLIHWSSNPADDETVQAIPLAGQTRQLLGILLVGSSRRPYVELRQHIRSASLLAGGAGMLLAIVLSGWAAARVTRPVEELAQAARDVAEGNWNTQVTIESTDEVGELAASFNRMTRQLLEQKERLVQTERVAAWRELARRLAHELKNPLFPLQLTVENLLRARQQSPEQFEETFQESSSTLLAEISNLKTIISRFSEFSRMPQPRLQSVDLNEIVRNVARLFQAQLHTPGRPPIECKLEITEAMDPVAADPELMHRALTNLVLNAMDAMSEGGVLTLHTRQSEDRALIEVSDTGTGLTPEECDRLFTPYYTSKAHGTGLGLAILPSETGRGTTFQIELPKRGAVPS
jgi:two-component system, NtrC family, nitrogen regulation sensor histidine kinase NtrY